MKKLSIELNNKLNNKYNQLVIITMLGLAVTIPWIVNHSNSKPKPASSAATIETIASSALVEAISQQPVTMPSIIDQPEIQAEAEAETDTEAAQPIKQEVIAVVTPVAVPARVHHASKTIILPAKISLPAKKVQNTKIPPAAVTINQTAIDHHFIAKVEGVVLKGYVPLPKQTKSGVTIAAGFDLGQMTIKEFNSLPMSDALRAKLLPYVGLKKFEAVKYLKAHPLHISQNEVTQLNTIAANKILIPLSISYKKASGKSFTSLPPAAQTALFSFAYQYGSNFMNKKNLNKLWHYYVSENWSNVIRTLHSFKLYQGRRKQEARLLASL